MNTHSIQHQTFPDGGFVLHKIPAPSGNQTISAWYDSTGLLFTAEYMPSERRVTSPRVHTYLQQHGTRRVWLRDRQASPTTSASA